MSNELKKDIDHKDILYRNLEVSKKKMDFLVHELSKVRMDYTELARKYCELDRKIFERTVGITKIEKKTKTSTKKIPKTLEELTSDERETLLAQLLDIQARRNRR